MLGPPRALRWLSRLGLLQLEKPVQVLALAAVLTLAALALATRLTVLPGFEAMLPDSRPSVQELHRVSARTGGGSTLFIVLEGENTEGLRRAGDALVPALVALGPPWVTEAEDGVHDVVKFLEPRAGLYADLPALTRVRDDLQARYEYEVGERAGTNLAMAPEDIPPPIDAALIKQRLGGSSVDDRRFPGGYYQSQDGKTLVVTVRSGVLASDFAHGDEALARVRAVVERVSPRSFDPSAKWGITGDLAIGLVEFNAIKRDLTDVGIAGAALIIGVVFLYYLRLRMLIALGITIAVGLAWTFGLTEMTLGHLNLATGFLFTIVGGNGINFAIIFMARYLEERREGRPLREAILTAQQETWKPTLTAAGAAAASYGSLLVTEFRGFREFGIIGGAGMILCWTATYLVLPPLLVVMDRIAPEGGARTGWLGRIQRLTRDGIPFGRPFAALVERAPRALLVLGLALAVGGAAVMARYLRTDPMEYDLQRVQSDRSAGAEEQRLILLAKDITGYIGLDGMAILADRTDQIAPLKAALEARRDAAPEGAKPFKAVYALQDFIPKDQPAKIEILNQLQDRVLRARRRGLVNDADWATISRFMPPKGLEPFGLAELPEGLARSFSERDGTRGRIVYISPTSDEQMNDAHYLFLWAESFRRTVLPDQSVILGSGRAVIYADMWAAIIHDVPRAIAASFGATLVLILLAFRGKRAALQVVFALLVGIAWTGGMLALFHTKLNFLNFIALPITFGIGVDYAVNIVDRDLDVRDALLAVRRTGGAVILCSLTTLLGYLALVRSTNFAVRSLGVAAVLGEIACLLAAVIVLPAALTWWRGRAGASEGGPA